MHRTGPTSRAEAAALAAPSRSSTSPTRRRHEKPPSRASGTTPPVYIPTGWYPPALAVTRGEGRRYRLWVVNTRGHGYGPGVNGSVITQGSGTGGSVSAVDLPVTDGKAAAWTRQVRANDRLDRGTIDPCRPGDAGVPVSPALCPPKGKRSPIRHVVY